MALSRDHHETVVARAKRDPAFQNALITEALQSFLDGEVAPGLIVLRDCINASIGFVALSKATGIPEKSLMRMVGPRGNPTATNLFAMVAALRGKGAPPIVIECAEPAKPAAKQPALRHVAKRAPPAKRRA
jgi:DNA-binding phage protein